MFKSKPAQIIRLFTRQEKGAMLIVLAISIPIILIFIALVIDTAQLMRKKARLADALNESVLAIAAVNNANKTGSDIEQNKLMLTRYLSAYLPDSDILSPDVKYVTYNVDGDQPSDISYVEYQVSAIVDIDTLLPLSHLKIKAFDPKVNVSNNRDEVGRGRKHLLSKPPTDYAFIVDFSGSMTSPYKDTLDPNSVTQSTRIAVLKKVVERAINEVLSSSSESTFTIVPFDIGVPIRLSTRNEVGGDEVGCSLPYASDSSVNTINFAFWANKRVTEAYQSGSSSNDLARQIRDLDYIRYLYFLNIAGRARFGELNSEQTVSTWCQNNGDYDQLLNQPYYKYSCESHNSLNTSVQNNHNEIQRNYDNVLRLKQKMKEINASTFINSDNISYTTTINNMFKDENTPGSNIITFTQPWAPNAVPYRMWNQMCQSSTILVTSTENNSDLPPVNNNPNNIYVDTAVDAEIKIASSMSSAKAQAYMIPLTNNRSILNEFNTMIPNGGTDSTSGLLRALPELAKGKNKRKAIIIISDGDDNEDPKIISEKFHKTYNLCDKIRTGLIDASPGTTIVDMYFISINDDETNPEKIAFWGNYCVGINNAVTAPESNELWQAISSIINTETAVLVNQ